MTTLSNGPLARLGRWLSLIKFSHSVFALPFALAALLVATDGRPSLALLAKVVLAAVLARAAAMAYNRYADRRLDAANPRTAAREIPSGALGANPVLGFAAVCGVGFALTALWISPLCFWLAWPTLGWLLGYSHAKRFTALAHVWLGVALGLAPLAAWVAARGAVDASLLAPALLGAGVVFWVSGFDILYACQDEEHDRTAGLHSIPARYGRARALRVAQVFHALAVLLFAGFGVQAGLGAAYLSGVVLAAGLLVHEHRLISPTDMARVDAAFFTMNGLVSLAMLGCTALDLYV